MFTALAGVVILLLIQKAGPPEKAAEQTSESGPTTVATLYFADKDHARLVGEDRVLPRPADTVRFGEEIIRSLLEGPKTDDLMGTIPRGTELKSLYYKEDGIAYADFTKEISDNHPGGSESELLTLYAIVNSLCLNIPEVRAVKILIEGGESATLAGHMDLRFAFTPDKNIIR